MKSGTLIILCGVAGSGKSTWAAKFAKKYEDTVIVSRDQIRFKLFEKNDDYFSKEKQVYRSFIQKIQSNLDNGKTVIADATHIDEISRKKLLRNLNVRNHDVGCIFFNYPIDICKERNTKREGRARVPDDVIENMFISLKDPRGDSFDYDFVATKYYNEDII